jgi:DNA-binding GntR family transcriptional regulator
VDLPRLQNSHLKDEAYRVIKEAITSLQFGPGDPVIEGDLARRLGISKTPVRNALVRLEQEGLVQTLPFRGTFVAAVSVSDVRELYEVRGALEELAIRLLMEHLSPSDVLDLRGAISGVEVKLQEGHLEESFDSIREFHDGIVSRSGNHWLIEMYGNLADHLTRIRNICGHIPGRVEKSAREHEKIIDSIEKYDSLGAIAALRAHLESLTEDYSRAAAETIQQIAAPAVRRARGNGV